MTARPAFKAGDYITVYNRAGGRCGICGEPVEPADVSIDHIHPLARGGAHEPDNWQLANRTCNVHKQARMPGDAVQHAARQPPAASPRVQVTAEELASGMTTTEAAARRGVSQNTLRKWSDEGRVPAVRRPGGGYRRFDPDVIERVAREMGIGK